MNLDWPAGVPTNEAVLLELRRRQTDPLVETVDKVFIPDIQAKTSCKAKKEGGGEFDCRTIETTVPSEPTFPLGVERRPDTLLHFGWNPVYWSDYPLQPMWTVALPKIPAPVLSRQLPPFPVLPSYYPPTEWMSLRSCPNWMPNLPQRTFHWNPYVSDTNTNFRDLLSPPTFKCQ